jgi:dienelactone hydrolase
LSAAAVVVYIPLERSITAFRLLSAIRRIADGDPGRSASIVEEKVVRRFGSEAVTGILYRPAGLAPASGILLIPGVSELGCYHPRLVALSRALADAGFLVLTPDIAMFREFRIHPPPLEEISFWLREARRLEGGRNLRRLGIAGISFSATLALIAAAQSRNQDLYSYVFGVGAFDDLIRCSHDWFAAGPITVSEGFYPTRCYAKWIIMLAALDRLQSVEDRAYLQNVLRNLLLQQGVPAQPANITASGRRWLELALQREDQSDPDLAGQIEKHVAAFLYPALATGPPAADLRRPVFLAHGAYDDLIPPDESRRLREKISQAKSYLLISPFLTHTHPSQAPMGLWTKARAGLDLLVFLYRLAGVV